MKIYYDELGNVRGFSTGASKEVEAKQSHCNFKSVTVTEGEALNVADPSKPDKFWDYSIRKGKVVKKTPEEIDEMTQQFRAEKEAFMARMRPHRPHRPHRQQKNKKDS